MALPDDVGMPDLRRLESMFDRQDCLIPNWTPSRATVWTGLHAPLTGAHENTNSVYVTGLKEDTPTMGDMLWDQGFSTACKGK